MAVRMPRGNDSSKKPDPWPHLLVMIFFEVTFIWMPAILLFIFAVSLPEVHFNFRAAAILVIKRLVIDTSHPAVWASASMDWVVSAIIIGLTYGFNGYHSKAVFRAKKPIFRRFAYLTVSFILVTLLLNTLKLLGRTDLSRSRISYPIIYGAGLGFLCGLLGILPDSKKKEETSA